MDTTAGLMDAMAHSSAHGYTRSSRGMHMASPADRHVHAWHASPGHSYRAHALACLQRQSQLSQTPWGGDSQARGIGTREIGTREAGKGEEEGGPFSECVCSLAPSTRSL